MINQHERKLEGTDDLPGKDFDIVFAPYAFHQTDEFITAEPRQHVDQTHMLGQSGRDRDE